IVNNIYGDYRDPNELGSGGGSDSGAGGNGGGLVRITAQQMAIDGTIAADGVAGSRFAGGGSGGGIKIVTGSLSGSGSIHANGGNGAEESGGGGGGRVALFYDTLSASVLNNVQALGGGGLGGGASGTICLKAANATGELIVRGTGRETPLPEGALEENLTIDAARVSVSQLGLPELRLVNGAVLTHPGATTSGQSVLSLNANTVRIDATSRIDVSGRGYLGGHAGDNNLNQSRTLNNAIGSERRSGGSYGGL